MLPAGLWFRRNEMYTLAPDADPAALHAREGEEGEVLRLFDTAGQTLSLVEIRERLGKGAGRTLDALAGEGILVYHSNTVQKTGDKTEKMLALDIESDEAMSRVRRSARAAGRRFRARGRHLDEPEGAFLYDGRERRCPARYGKEGHSACALRGADACAGLFRCAARGEACALRAAARGI